MSKILQFGKKNNNKLTHESRLENTMKLLKKLLVEGVITREEEKQIVQMMNDKETILNCPDKPLMKSYVVACDHQLGKCKKPNFSHITALNDFEHENEEMQEIFDLEKLTLRELWGNLEGKNCIVKDMEGNIKEKGVMELLFGADEERMIYKIRMSLDGEILSDMELEELFYVSDDFKNYNLQILNGDNHFNVEREEPIKTEECPIYFAYLEKRVKFMKKNMTPEEKDEMDNMMMNCLSGIIESETGNKPIIEKEGESIKITTEEPTINWKKK